jgi:aspartyl-tRNA(Asn)/glutamyl-tRNA(Gln) amidotransferase subunit C
MHYPPGFEARGEVIQATFPGEHMALNLNDVTRIAHLARLELAEGEAQQTLGQLNNIFALVEKMQAVDTTGIEPLAHPVDQIAEVELRLRDDAVTEQIDREAFQRCAPATQDGLYLVPKVIE